MPADILDLILADHTWFRARFIALDELRAAHAPSDELGAVWAPLGARLDVHAAAEEDVFYPQLLQRGADDPEDETLDAIGDHNDIRDGVRDAGAATVGSPEWWAAVGRTRVANDEHMAEEEREGLADFRENAPPELRRTLGARFAEYMATHTAADVDTGDKDPEEYVAEYNGSGDEAADGSLRIGSLKGSPGR